MRICVMVEGQEGVDWEQWLALAEAADEHGLDALFRSDHYGSVAAAEDRASLDALGTLAALAARTRRVRLGTLVSPATFRHPSVLARQAATIDHVSGGRFELGLGAGWNEREHAAYGFPFPPTSERVDMLEEQLQIVRGQWQDGPFSFDGAHYRLAGSNAQPKPVQERLPLIVGGAAGRRSLRLAARHADEYNTIFIGPEEARARRARLDEACAEERRDPGSIRFSVMLPGVVAADGAELRDRLGGIAALRGEDGAEAARAQLAEHGVVGTVAEVAERVQAFAAAGVDRLMLQLQDHRDVGMLASLGELARATAAERPPLMAT